MKLHTNRIANIAVVLMIALAGAMTIVGLQLHKVDPRPEGSRVAEYTNVAELNRDASLVATLDPVDGKRESTSYPTAILPTSRFTITNASDATLIGQQIKVPTMSRHG
jgi:hypothetical protein